jgi:hypothetical protein
MKRIALSLVIAVFSSLVLSAQAVNVTGKWVLDVQTDQGSGTPTVTMKQDGEKVTGHYTGQLGDTDITGTIKANQLTFSFSGDAQGQAFKVVYTGTVEKDTIKGTVDIGGVATGTFTGKKQ